MWLFDKFKKKPTYTLETQFYAFTNETISASLFDDVISSFYRCPEDFMSLAPHKPIQDSIFIQVTTLETADFPFMLEVGFDDKGAGYTRYRLYTKDKNVVLRHFVDYWQEQRIPDISFWADVSADRKQ